MENRFTPVLVSLLVFQLMMGYSLVGFTQETPDSSDSSSLATLQPGSSPIPNSPAFSQQELDQMLAPIALYPDSLLSQILIAATYPLEVVEATRWAKANPMFKGEQAVQAVQDMNWDPSVKSLVAFPQILMQMDEKLAWMQELGDAFLSQQPAVVETVQALRQKAQAAGNLTSNDKIQVTRQGQTIVIAPENPQVVYVPYYNPMVVYGPWWWAGYPPVCWPLWPGYVAALGFGKGFYWGSGIGVGAGFFFGAFDYLRHQVLINRATFRQPWHHSPDHRRGVRHRDTAMRQRFGRGSAVSEGRGDFRGHGFSSFDGGGGRENREGARGGSRRLSENSGRSFSHVGRQPGAFDGVGHGADVQRFGSRGHKSFGGFSSRSSGGFRGNGGGGGRSFGGGGSRGGHR